MQKLKLLFAISILYCSCSENRALLINEGVRLVVLGNVQDGGSPHIGCQKECCKALFANPDPTRKVVSLGLLDFENEKKYLFEATPDITTQLKVLEYRIPNSKVPDGIFLTHAHIGHYTGLQFIGREALGGKDIPVWAMPKMAHFLQTNGPWDHLVKLRNIQLRSLTTSGVSFNEIVITPFLVPHRDEYSETVGYRIAGPNKSAVFIPDIDKWEKWSVSIVEVIRDVDYAFIDASFFDEQEINHRAISEIPHPFVVESMKLFDREPKDFKSKIYFTHLNHTNPLLDPGSEASEQVRRSGYNIARFGDEFGL